MIAAVSQPRIASRPIGIAALIVVLDLFSKWILDRIVPVAGWWLASDQVGLRVVQNHRFAFSLGPGNGIAPIVALLALVLLIGALMTNQFGSGLWIEIGTGLVLGGAISNTIDRIIGGSVTDFVAIGPFPRF